MSLTSWYPASIAPVRNGFYLVNHEKESWITGDNVLARFTLPDLWERPLGWPSPKEGHGFCSECAMETGRVFDPGCRVYKPVAVTKWRGLEVQT